MRGGERLSVVRRCRLGRGTPHTPALPADGEAGARAGGYGGAYRHLQAGGSGPRARRAGGTWPGPPGRGAGGTFCRLHPRPLPGRRSGRGGRGAALPGEQHQPCRRGCGDRKSTGSNVAWVSREGLLYSPEAGRAPALSLSSAGSDESPIRGDSCPRPSVLPSGVPRHCAAPRRPAPRKMALTPGAPEPGITVQHTIEITVLSKKQQQQQQKGKKAQNVAVPPSRKGKG